MKSAIQSRWVPFFFAQLALCLLLLAIWPHLAIDDSYIFLTYARQLATTGTFSFNPGELSYGFSSPAYLLLLAGTAWLTHIAVSVFLSNLLGVVMCALASLAVWELWGELGERPSSRAIPFAALLFSGPWFFTAWFVFGMETGLAILCMLSFLLWLAKVRAGAPRLPWLLLGIVAASVLSITRLESGIYIGVAILFAAVTAIDRRRWLDLALVLVCAGAVEAGWLLFAHHIFGVYMPWSSKARLLYYLPGRFSLVSDPEFYGLSFLGRTIIAVKAAAYMMFAGPMKLLLVALPLGITASLLWMRRAARPLANLSTWLLSIAGLGMLIQIAAFAYLFPLAQNRHLAPYIAAVWAILAPRVTSLVLGAGRRVQVLALVAATGLWIAGAVQFHHGGARLWPLHTYAASGLLHPGDRVAAESIGILSFEAPVHLVDLGGITDRDIWPLLSSPSPVTTSQFIAWDLAHGADELLVTRDTCPNNIGLRYGPYCLLTAAQARQLQRDAASR